MYIKNELSIVTTNMEHLNCSSIDIEILWVKIINPKHRNYIVATCYRPPNGNPKSFTDHIENSLAQIKNIDDHDIFLLGDMNITYSNNKCPARKHLKKLLVLNNISLNQPESLL